MFNTYKSIKFILSITGFAVLVTSFAPLAHADRSKLTKEAKDLLENVEKSHNNLFKIATEKTEHGADRSITYEELLKPKNEKSEEEKPDWLLSGLKRGQLEELTQNWYSSTFLALAYIKEKAHNNNGLMAAYNSCLSVARKLNNIILEHKKAHESLKYVVITERHLKSEINNMKELLEKIHKYEELLQSNKTQLKKLEFTGIFTLYKTDKYSAKALLTELIDVLFKEVHILRKRVFEINSESASKQAKTEATQAAAEKITKEAAEKKLEEERLNREEEAQLRALMKASKENFGDGGGTSSKLWEAAKSGTVTQFLEGALCQLKNDLLALKNDRNAQQLFEDVQKRAQNSDNILANEEGRKFIDDLAQVRTLRARGELNPCEKK